MPVFVWRGGRFVNKVTGEPMLTDAERAAPPPTPTVISDIPEYRSPIDGKLITSRSYRREDLKANDCVPYERPASVTPGYSNPSFARKRGLPLNEEGRAALDKQRSS